MFTGFSQMLQAIFRAFTKLATAAEKGASALDHVAGWGESTAASFADQAKADQELKAATFAHNLKIRKEELAKLTTAVPAEEPPVAP